jgi:hypothetical protein
MNMFLKILLGCLILTFTACNKTGAYGFKEGQTYTCTRSAYNLIKGNNVKVIKVSMDYVVFTQEGVKPPNIWYNRKLTGDRLRLIVDNLEPKD